MESEQTQQKNDILLELNFIPTWARQPPSVNPYLTAGAGSSYEKSAHEHHGDRSQHRRRERFGDGKREHAGRTPDRRRESRDSQESRPARQPFREQRVEPDLPADVHFIPEKKRLGAVVRLIRDTGRAYPFMDMAVLFLNNPENYLIKMAIRKEPNVPEANSYRFYQCSICKAVFLEPSRLQDHLLQEHEAELFDSQDVELEAPSGNFICVGRCGLSGTLIAPPNYHGFEEAVRTLHRTRFVHMPYEEYRAKVEMVHDAEQIEQWKASCRKQRRYRIKGEEGEFTMTRTQAQQWFMQNKAGSYIHGTSKVMIPAGSARSCGDEAVMHTMRRAWNRESKHPFTLAIALRPAFKHMGLHLFKVGEGMTFVTSIKPNPLNMEHTIDSIREVIAYLQANPGCTRQQMIEGLRPGAAGRPDEVAEVITPLRWLVERGHVIEFFNGTLSVPASKAKV